MKPPILQLLFWRLSLIALLASLGACNGGNPPDDSASYAKNGLFTSDRQYEAAVASPNPFCAIPEGCRASLFFSAKGTGTLIFTDIANAVTYTIANNTLTTQLKGQGDIPNLVQFDILENAKTLVRRDTGAVFHLKAATTKVYRSTGAIACEVQSGISLSASEKLLKDASINPQSSSCGYLTTLVLPAVCGITTNAVYLHVIPHDQLAAAQKLGFALADADPASTVTPRACP